MRDFLRNIYLILSNVYQNTFVWSRFKLLNRQQYKLILKNKELKDTHCGERCFILGNGPSLNNIDFSKLADEFVFTVNQIARKKDFHLLKSNVHFWADRAFFDIDMKKAEDAELFNIMKSVNTDNNKPKVFFPVEEFDFVKKTGLDKELDSHYFMTGLSYEDPFFNNINYSKIVPGFGTVIQWCITMALYMGFSEIYLLGCDNTGIITTIKSALKEDVIEYSYEISDNEKKRMQKLVDKYTLYEYVVSYANTLKGYSVLNDFCRQKGVRIYNCSNPTTIDSIEKKDFNDVL